MPTSIIALDKFTRSFIMEEEMTIDDFKRWKNDALIVYLRKRGFSAVGNKKTLVARAFVAWELKSHIAPTEKEYQETVRIAIA